MDMQGNIEINASTDKPGNNFSGVQNEPTNDSNNQKSSGFGIGEKIDSLKKMVKIDSFFGKKNEEKNPNGTAENPENSNDIQPIENQTWRGKIQTKIVSTVEVERNIPVFLGLAACGCGLIVLSVFLLPFIIVSPHKFCLCFAFGSLFITISFLFLKGTKNYVKSLCAKDRYVITILYFVSIILGIGFSLCKKYIFSILCAIFQCVALVLFILSFIPGGKVGIKCIKDFFASPFTRLWASSIASGMEG